LFLILICLFDQIQHHLDRLGRELGIVYVVVHFHDWNNLGRVAEIDFQGKPIGTLENYDGAGVWLAFPVTARDSAEGTLEVSANPTHANAQITQIVLTR
jgi:hypothetical protein